MTFFHASFFELGSSLAETQKETERVMMEEEPETEQGSVSKTMAELPSYLGRYEQGSEILQLPLPRQEIKQESLDSLAQKLLQQTFMVPMTLREIHEHKPQLWNRLLEQMNIPCIARESKEEPSKELCKVSTYAKAEGDKGNTTLKLSKENHHHLAILDTGAGVSIITKEKIGRAHV